MRFWLTWQPVDYRRKAAKYLMKARSASSHGRRQRYSELASLLLAHAEMRDREVAAQTASQERSKQNPLPG